MWKLVAGHWWTADPYHCPSPHSGLTRATHCQPRARDGNKCTLRVNTFEGACWGFQPHQRRTKEADSPATRRRAAAAAAALGHPAEWASSSACTSEDGSEPPVPRAQRRPAAAASAHVSSRTCSHRRPTRSPCRANAVLPDLRDWLTISSGKVFPASFVVCVGPTAMLSVD